MKITRKFQTHTFVRKYLSKKVGVELGSIPWEINERTLWGTIICQLMNTENIHVYIYPHDLDKFKDNINILYPARRIDMNLINWSFSHSLKLASFVRKEINQELYILLQSNYKRKGDIKRIILAWMEFYEITEDDIPYDTLVKSYYRARKRPNNIKQIIDSIVR